LLVVAVVCSLVVSETDLREINAERRAGSLPDLMGRADIKESIDWREEGIVNEPINQMSCGSCWTFATTGLLEAKLAQFSGTLPKLAEGYLVDCGTGNGCAGGNMQDGLESIMASQYIPLQQSYGLFQGYYTDNAAKRAEKCNTSAPNALEDVWLAYKYLSPKSEASALRELQKNPVPVGFYVTTDYQGYRGGVFEDTYCGSNGRGHAALIVGYTPEYWIIKNSYATNWGENGYIRLKRSHSAMQCGLFSRVWNIELIPRREIKYQMVNGLYTYAQGAAKCKSLDTEAETGWSLAVIPTKMHHAEALAIFHKRYGMKKSPKIQFNYFWIGMQDALSYTNPLWDDGFTKLGYMNYELRGQQPKTYGTLKMAKFTADGRWSSQNPATKLRILCSRTVTCKKLTKRDIPNSKSVTKFSSEVMIEGTTANVVCAKGFKRAGGSQARCVAGQWKLPVCNAKKNKKAQA